MPEKFTHRMFARVRALFSDDWMGSAGKQFRQATTAISDFAKEHEVLEQTPDLAWKAINGKAEEKYAQAVANYAAAENQRIEAELQRRTLEAKLRTQEAENRKAEILAIEAEMELIRKLQDVGVMIQRDEQGNLTLVPLKRSEPKE